MINKIKLTLPLLLSISPLIGCNSSINKEYKDISHQNIVNIYNENNYVSFVSFKEEGVEEYNTFISCTSSSDDDKYIYFYIFDTKEEASKYSNNHKWNGLLFFFSTMFGNPTWITNTTYNNIAIEYSSNDAYTPFKDLIK